jgi:hypothetical protein
VSCELQGGGLSPLALTVEPFFLTNKKAESFWDSASSFKNSFLSLFYFIIYPVEPLNEEAACSLLSYPNRRICVAGMAIAVAFTRTGVCQDCVSVMSEQVVNDKVFIEDYSSSLSYGAFTPIKIHTIQPSYGFVNPYLKLFVFLLFLFSK